MMVMVMMMMAMLFTVDDVANDNQFFN